MNMWIKEIKLACPSDYVYYIIAHGVAFGGAPVVPSIEEQCELAIAVLVDIHLLQMLT
jgi:hypothetical protein